MDGLHRVHDILMFINKCFKMCYFKRFNILSVCCNASVDETSKIFEHHRSFRTRPATSLSSQQDPVFQEYDYNYADAADDYSLLLER